MLGDDLRAVDGAEIGSWIEPALGESGAVEDQVPKLFEAYARVFHPASDADGAYVTWAEVTRRLGRIAHPEMQWHQIVGTSDTFGIDGSKWSGYIPADPEHCFARSTITPSSTRPRPNRGSARD